MLNRTTDKGQYMPLLMLYYPLNAEATSTVCSVKYLLHNVP